MTVLYSTHQRLNTEINPPSYSEVTQEPLFPPVYSVGVALASESSPP